MNPVKIVIVDIKDIFLEGLSVVLRNTFQPEVVLTARSVAEVLQNNPDISEPDLLVLGKDKLVPRIADNVKKVRGTFPNTKIVVMMPPDCHEDPVDMLKSGALACLSKAIETDDLLSCIQLVLSGRIIVSNRFAERFFGTLTGTKTYTRKKEILSNREIEITKLVALGKTNKEISQTLCVTENTVKVHMKHILSKLKCKNRQQLVAFASLATSLSSKDVFKPEEQD
jgi:DNA-binding NarL/FixJ family response regulator